MADPLTGFTFTIVNRVNSIARCAEVIAGLEVWIQGATEISADEIGQLIQKHMPEDTGELKASVETQQLSVVPPVWAVGPTAYYAPYVNYGTGPHVPNVTRVIEWAIGHGFDPTGLINHMAIAGTAAHPFMEPAVEEAQGMGLDLFFDKIAFNVVLGV